MKINKIQQNIQIGKMFFQKLVDGAKLKLQQYNEGKRSILSGEYKEFLERIADKKCPECGAEIEKISLKIKSDGDVNSCDYEFGCGHKHLSIEVSETIKIWEQIGGKIREENKKPHVKFMTRSEPGRNSLSVDGVTVTWSADKKNNLWNHKIVDIKTGKLLHHDDNEPLKEHKH